MFFRPGEESFLDISPVDFEKATLRMLEEQFKSVDNKVFVHNKQISASDGTYQIDGYIEFSVMGVLYKTLLECKLYKNSITREKVATFYGKIISCGAQKGILVSTAAFQSGAIKYATEHGIALVQLLSGECLYHTRSKQNYRVAKIAILSGKVEEFVGVLQTASTESIINCSYLGVNNLALVNFLLSP